MAASRPDKATEKSLTDRIQALPPELFDQIYKHTVTATHDDVRNPLRPPLRLQLDHKSRELFAQSYYGEGPFSIHMLSAQAGLDSLGPTHAGQIREIHLTGLCTSQEERPNALVEINRIFGKMDIIRRPLEAQYHHITFKWNVNFLAGDKATCKDCQGFDEFRNKVVNGSSIVRYREDNITITERAGVLL